MDNKDRYRYVYEFDLNNFFEEVDLFKVNQELSQTLGYPPHVVALLEKLNQSVVKLAEEDKLEEPSRDILLNSSGEFTKNRKVSDLNLNQVYESLLEAEKEMGIKHSSSELVEMMLEI